MAAVTAGLAASLGAGYTAAKATLGDASTYVAKGDAISHVNGESRQVDATSSGGLAKNLEDVDVTPLPNGKVAAVNRQTHKVTITDGATLEQRTAEKGNGAGGAATIPPAVVVSGQVGWLLDYSTRSVRQVGGGDGKRIRLDGKPVDGAPGRNGSLIVLTEPGRLYEVSTNGKVRDIDYADARNAALTVAGGHSYLVQVGGDVVEVDSGTPVKTANVEGATGLGGGRMLVNSQRTGGKHVLIVQSARVSVVDPVAGKFFSINHRATTQNLGKPVEFRDRIYLPDYDDHTVIVLDEKTQLRVAKAIPVPGTRGTFAVTVDGGRLWANDQYSNRMVEIDVDGTRHEIDKGKGNGVRGDQPKPPKTPTGTGATPPPSVTPTKNPPPNTTSNPPPASTPSTPSTPSTKKIKVPEGLVGTNYQDACAKVEQARLRCQPVAAGEDGGDSDEVIDVTPGPGSLVDEGTQVVIRYYGPTTVPAINDATTTPAEQCQAIEQAKLKCATQPADQPASSIDQFGFVADSSPAPGEQAKTGDTVTVKYYATFPMPQYSNTNPPTPGVSTCQALSAKTVQLPGGQTKTLKCNPAEGTKENNAAANIGAVYDQTPQAGQPVSVDKPITLTYYAGSHAVKDYANSDGGDAGAAQADCRKWFTDCGLVEGASAGRDGAKAGKVERSDPGAGATAKVGDPVKIYVWRGTAEVPKGLAGNPVGDVCKAIEDAGLICDSKSNHPYSKQVNVAAPNGYPVSPAEGTTVPLGTTVVVPNATVQPVNIFKYHSNDDPNVWVMRVEGKVPEGYSPNGQQVTTGYREGDVPGGTVVRGFFCSTCFGHSPNHYVTLDTKPANAEWTGGASTGVQLLPASGGSETCNLPGTAPIWRVTTRDESNGRDIRTYDMQSNPQRPSSFSTEFLGCGLG